MSNQVFNMAEAENMFEIGRCVQWMHDKGSIEIEDSKNAFLFAMKLAVEFEKEHADTEEYYTDIEEFVSKKILKEFGTDE